MRGCSRPCATAFPENRLRAGPRFRPGSATYSRSSSWVSASQREDDVNPVDILLWGALPYVILLVLVGGTIWRYRYDQFGWTTRSSQLYESRLLRIGSPMFHFGLLVVLGGHLMGLLIPKAWTDLVVSQESYHLVALTAGTIAGVATLLGIGLLIYRRRTTGPVFLATTNNDKLMYVPVSYTHLRAHETVLDLVCRLL